MTWGWEKETIHPTNFRAGYSILFWYQLVVNWWFGARWFGILGVPLSNNLFHKGIPGIETTNLPLVDLTCFYYMFEL